MVRKPGILFRFLLIGLIGVLAGIVHTPNSYAQARYISTKGNSLGGVTLPLTHEVTNCLFNNPACLARNMGMQGDLVNLNLELNSGSLNHFGFSTFQSLSLNGMKKILDKSPNEVNAYGAGVSTAFSWGGLSAGLLVQEKVMALYDGTQYHYSTLSQTIPAVGVAVPLARGVVRVGYGLQWVNKSVGSVSTAQPQAFLDGLSDGQGFSHNASVNIIIPYRFLPTFSLAAKNLFGTAYSKGSLLSRASQPVAAPGDEPMILDAALDFQIRITGESKTHWYFQYQDISNQTLLPVLERLSNGLDIQFNRNFSIQAGFKGLKYALGLHYRGEQSSVGLSWYQTQSPLPVGPAWNTHYQLQYTLHFGDQSKRSENDRD